MRKINNDSNLRKEITIFVLVVIIGVILGLLGDIDFKATKPNYFWPGGVVQSVAGIFFGFTGVIAGTVFPIISSALRGVAPIKILLWTTANFIQSLIPYLMIKIFDFKPYEFNKKTILCFIIGCVFFSNIVGAQFASCALIYTGEVTNGTEYLQVVIRWAIANIPSAIIFGLLLLKFFAPALRECKIYARLETKNSSNQ